MRRACPSANWFTAPVLVVATGMIVIACKSENPLRGHPLDAYTTGSIDSSPYPGSDQRNVVVRPNDTLSRIALRNRVLVQSLVVLNSLDRTTIQVGQILYLPTF